MNQPSLLHIFLLILGGLLATCQAPSTTSSSIAQNSQHLFQGTGQIQIKQTEEGYKLFHQDSLFTIKGGAIHGEKWYLASLAHAGGNTVRTYMTDHAQEMLDSAEILGLHIILGLYMVPGEKGFPYEDEMAVKQQQDSLLRIVQAYKDHPALLCWGLGNELELHHSGSEIWPAINQLSKAIHQFDPTHPTVAIILPNLHSMREASKYLTEVDILGINSFGSIQAVIQEYLPRSGWKGPYLFTEWGVPGAWEADLTPWQAPIEGNDQQKAIAIRNHGIILNEANTNNCLGGVSFFWGQKMERTHTWFSILGEQGEKTAMLDQIHHLWTDQWPHDLAPRIDTLLIEHSESDVPLYAEVGQEITIIAQAWDQEDSVLRYNWEVVLESPYPHAVQDGPEARPDSIEKLFISQTGNSLSFYAPKHPGPYRVFVYVYDRKGNIAHANLPFFVTLSSQFTPSFD